MNNDAVILLVNAQWERGLIVPDHLSTSTLAASCRAAVADGLCDAAPYQVSGGSALCYVLTQRGWERLGELLNATVVFPASSAA